jgi:hypothetical protein
MIRKKPDPDLVREWTMLSEKIMPNQQAKAEWRLSLKLFRFSPEWLRADADLV